MAKGADLSASQVASAIEYNRVHHPLPFVKILRTTLGLGVAGPIDEAFVRAVADWQESHVGSNRGDGKIGPRTEAHLNIQHPKAAAAAAAAIKLQAVDFTLFDSWGNDLRDNNSDGVVDGPKEGGPDGGHLGRVFPEIRTIAGVYNGGWNFLPKRQVIVQHTRTIKGQFRYFVCADIVSGAYKAAGVMTAQRSTLNIHAQFQTKGFIWQRSESYPDVYLPGDFIHNLDGAEGHAGIVVRGGPTRGGDEAPIVVQLPGPSTQISDGTYNPERTNDVTVGPWSAWRITMLKKEWQYLGRLLLSRQPA